MRGKVITSQFWVGRFADEASFGKFIAEDNTFYAEENEDRDDIALTEFAASQGARSYDHDFFEAGFNAMLGSVADRFVRHSWCEHWGEEFTARVRSVGITDFNAFLMIGIDVMPIGKSYRQIRTPRSASGEDWKIDYLGEITHAST